MHAYIYTPNARRVHGAEIVETARKKHEGGKKRRKFTYREVMHGPEIVETRRVAEVRD